MYMQNDFINLDIEKEFKQTNNEVHLRIQQRNGKKCWTFVEGLNELNTKDSNFVDNLAKIFKKKFNCSATIKKPENIIQLQGDHRDEIKTYLLKEKIISQDKIKIHGF
jgi:translation initiation factor 1